MSNGIWEATYAYDIMCRIKANLERHTRATVWTTIEDGKIGYTVPASDRLVQRRDAFLLTRPRYRLEDPVLGVHLRWYLTNDIILNRLGAEGPALEDGLSVDSRRFTAPERSRRDGLCPFPLSAPRQALHCATP